MNLPVNRYAKIAVSFAVLASANGLAACSAGQISSLLPSSSLLGNTKSAQSSPAPNQIKSTDLAALPPAAPSSTASTVKAPHPQPATPTAIKTSFANTAKSCPKFRIWRTGKFATVYARGQSGNSKAIRHQIELQSTARECQSLGNGNLVKLGIKGRILLGPKGIGQTRIPLPFNVHLTEKGKKISTKKIKSYAQISGNAGQFRLVDNIELPLSSSTPPHKYHIYIEIDQATADAS